MHSIHFSILRLLVISAGGVVLERGQTGAEPPKYTPGMAYSYHSFSRRHILRRWIGLVIMWNRTRKSIISP